MVQTKSSNLSRYRSRYIIGLLVGMFILLTFAALEGGMGELEQATFDYIYAMPNSLEWFAKLVTQLGSSWFAIGLIGLLFVVKWNPRPALVLARNVGITYLAVVILKFVIDRPRPVLLLQDFTARSVVAAGDAFPSGHTAMATVLSLTLLSYLPPRLRWLPAAWILLVAWSRIYLGVHAPLDVIGGLVIGVVIVILCDLMPWPGSKKH